MASRSPARWLAPLALLGAVAAILILVSASGIGGSGDGGSSGNGVTGSTATSRTTARTTTTSTTASSAHKYYVVKDGDVLSAIAASTGVPLSVIEQLNPNVDAQTLHAGQRIKLRP